MGEYSEIMEEIIAKRDPITGNPAGQCNFTADALRDLREKIIESLLESDNQRKVR